MRSEVLSKGFATGGFWRILLKSAKLPFAGMSVRGGKADFPVARPDFRA
jgi:hypothetical protein